MSVFIIFSLLFSAYPSGLSPDCRVCLACLLLSLEVVEEDGAFLRLFTPVAEDNARAVNNLAGVTFAVENAC